MTETERYVEIFRCAVNDLPLQTTGQIDCQELWTFAKRHNISAVISSALLGAGLVTDENRRLEWREAKYKNIRKTYLFDAERASVYRSLAEHGIRCAPLKGIVLNRLYPVYGTREFADNDLLLDGGTADTVSEVMEALGYTRKDDPAVIHYTFHKSPMFNFELHFRLFPKEQEELRSLARFFDSAASRMIPPVPPEEAWSLSNEDNYLFILAHAYKHYLESGIGLRTLSDIFLFRAKVPLDETSVAHGLKEMQIEDFAQTLEVLAEKIFSPETAFSRSVLNAAENALLDEILETGTFGNWNSYYNHRYDEFVAKSGKKSILGYYRTRLFPDMEQYKDVHPVYYNHKVLRPFFYIYRPFKGLIHSRRRLLSELRSVTQSKKSKSRNRK